MPAHQFAFNRSQSGAATASVFPPAVGPVTSTLFPFKILGTAAFWTERSLSKRAKKAFQVLGDRCRMDLCKGRPSSTLSGGEKLGIIKRPRCSATHQALGLWREPPCRSNHRPSRARMKTPGEKWPGRRAWESHKRSPMHGMKWLLSE